MADATIVLSHSTPVLFMQHDAIAIHWLKYNSYWYAASLSISAGYLIRSKLFHVFLPLFSLAVCTVRDNPFPWHTIKRGAQNMSIAYHQEKGSQYFLGIPSRQGLTTFPWHTIKRGSKYFHSIPSREGLTIFPWHTTKKGAQNISIVFYQERG